MSYTILTIPFNLKEKSVGDFLKKGFVIDDIIPDFFKSEDSKNPFLHVATFNQTLIKKTVINLFVKSNFPDKNISKNIGDEILRNLDFFDKKYLNSNHDYINTKYLNLKNQINKEEENKDFFKIPYNDFKLKYLYTKENNESKKQYKCDFEIYQIKLFVNKSATTKESIGFGFIEICLKWDFQDAMEMIENLEPVSELFRYYGAENKNLFEIHWNEEIEKLIEKFNTENQRENITLKGIDSNNFKIKELNKILLKEQPKKIHFKLIVDEILKYLSPNTHIEDLFDFQIEKNSISKPYVFHLSNFQSENHRKKIDFDKIEFNSKIYRMLRISGSENNVINSKSTFDSVSPDLYTRLFVLNEGAFVIEGINFNERENLINKYYPAFLFALNQKYLFNYMQEKINQLPLERKDDCVKYNANALKKLQETMIFADFSQIFTSISNYNEIDLFFEKLRYQFKIKDLKEEFFDSINGISKITQIKEREDNEFRLRKEEENRREQEKAETERRKEEENKRQDEIERSERISEFQSQKLNLVLLLLTIAQVWPNLLEIFVQSEDTRYKVVNIIFYSSIILIGLLFYFVIIPLKSENKLTVKEVILKLRSFSLLFYRNNVK
jgi:hypothetical protein